MFDLSLPAASLATAYPEQAQARPSMLDKVATRLSGPLVRRARIWRARRNHIVGLVNALSGPLERSSDAELSALAAELRVELRRDGFHERSVARAFALIREVAGRT